MNRKKVYKSPEIRIESLDYSTWSCKVKPWERKIKGEYVNIYEVSNLVFSINGNEVGGGFPIIVNKKKP